MLWKICLNFPCYDLSFITWAKKNYTEHLIRWMFIYSSIYLIELTQSAMHNRNRLYNRWILSTIVFRISTIYNLSKKEKKNKSKERKHENIQSALSMSPLLHQWRHNTRHNTQIIVCPFIYFSYFVYLYIFSFFVVFIVRVVCVNAGYHCTVRLTNSTILLLSR